MESTEKEKKMTRKKTKKKSIMATVEDKLKINHDPLVESPEEANKVMRQTIILPETHEDDEKVMERKTDTHDKSDIEKEKSTETVTKEMKRYTMILLQM